MENKISGLSLAQKALLAAAPQLTAEKVSSMNSPLKHVLKDVANVNGFGFSETKILFFWKKEKLRPTAELDPASYDRMLNAIKGINKTGHSGAEVKKMDKLIAKFERLPSKLPDAETYQNKMNKLASRQERIPSNPRDAEAYHIGRFQHHAKYGSVEQALIHARMAAVERDATRGGPSDLRSTETMRRENKGLMNAASETAGDAKSAQRGEVHEKTTYVAPDRGQKKQTEPAAARTVRFNLPS